MGASQSGPAITPEQLQQDKEYAERHSLLSKPDPQNANFAELATNLTALKVDDDDQKYKAFRDELLAFSLGESAFDYAERLFEAQPDNRHVMALLAETACMYDATKNKTFKGHWVDRLDLLQRAIDVSRKCIKENPNYEPCYRTYVVAASRSAESLYYYRIMRGMGLTENYHAIMKRGQRALELTPNDSLVALTLGSLNARCAQWSFPYSLYNRYYNLPSHRQLLKKAVEFNRLAVESDSGDLEAMYRLGSAYYQAGQLSDARRCFTAVRDEMVPRSLGDSKWQDQAHTMLAAGFREEGQVEHALFLVDAVLQFQYINFFLRRPV